MEIHTKCAMLANATQKATTGVALSSFTTVPIGDWQTRQVEHKVYDRFWAKDVCLFKQQIREVSVKFKIRRDVSVI